MDQAVAAHSAAFGLPSGGPVSSSSSSSQQQQQQPQQSPIASSRALGGRHNNNNGHNAKPQQQQNNLNEPPQPPGMHSQIHHSNLDLSAPQASSLLSAAGPPPTSGPAIPAGTAPGGAPTTALSVYHLITQLCQRPETANASPSKDGSETRRETALLELSKKREQYEDLALVLWHSFGVMSSLLQEITSVYPLLSPPALTAHASNRVCNALALLQCVASHHETRALFLQAHFPLFLYPFLNTTSKTRPFEYLRLTSLGVIGALVKQSDNSQVITFLLSTEIIPLCLRIMETGSELSKTVAIFIVQKILLDDVGLAYVCQTYERFYAVGTVLSNMVTAIEETGAVRLLKHVVRCYLRLSDNPRAREALRACLPAPLRDATFSQLLKNDHITKRCLATLLLNLSDTIES
ncbi:unnamed protein product [Sympodiomycopsis kandeliae]